MSTAPETHSKQPKGRKSLDDLQRQRVEEPVLLHTQDGHVVWRVSANHSECRRTPDGWRLTRRLNRVIDGTSDTGAVLVHAFRPLS
jgi:hypothetical protein